MVSEDSTSSHRFPGSEGLNEDLHTTTLEMEDKVKGRLLLDVVVQKGMLVFEMFASKDELLLVRGNAVWHISGQTLTFVLLLQSLRTSENLKLL